MKNANKIRLTESQLHRVIKESVKKVLSEQELPGNFAEFNKTWDLGDHSLHHHDLESNSNQYRVYMKVTDSNGNEVAKVHSFRPDESAKWTMHDCYVKLCRQLGITPVNVGDNY